MENERQLHGWLCRSYFSLHALFDKSHTQKQQDMEDGLKEAWKTLTLMGVSEIKLGINT